jgi:TatD DNase family protein
MYFIDTHAHINMLKKLNPEEAVTKAADEGVKYIINVGADLEGSRKSIEFARRFPNVFASVGIHPHYATDFGSKEIRILELLIQGEPANFRQSENISKEKGNNKWENVRIENGKYRKVIAVGETGFDFYRNLSSASDMEKAFISHIELALKYDIPVIIHDRDAHRKTLDVVKRYTGNKRFRAVVHCFSGDINFARECLEQGLYISFTGVITYPNAGNLRKVVEEVPLKRIFIETDSPFLAPQAKRGSENYPGFVKYIAEKIAEIKGCSIDEVADITSKNAESFFVLK